MNANGPILNRNIELFGAKVGFALHYSRTGKIVPSGGGVSVQWFANLDLLNGRFPENILKIMGPRETLEQGKKSVAEQFSYQYAIPVTGEMSAFLAFFREAFSVLAWVAEDTSVFPEDVVYFEPGFIRDLKRPL